MYAKALVLGADGKVSMAKGVKLAEELCVQGEPQSCLLAAGGYIEGRGVKKSMEKGAEILVAACAAGYPPACQLEKQVEKQEPDLIKDIKKKQKARIAAAAAASGVPPVAGSTPSPAASAPLQP
jgi:TPR repeat protein